jgi:hypothetical protein
LKIAFRTDNTIQKFLNYNKPKQNKNTQSGIYELACPDCYKAYIGKLAEISTPGLENIKGPSNITLTNQNSRNIYWNKDTLLETSKIPWKYYNSTKKRHTP